MLVGAILSDDENALQVLNLKRPAILDTIKSHSWKAIGIQHRGIREEQMPITLVITADDANSSIWWSDTIPNLENLLKGSVQIELLFGRIERS